ncbi:CRISPR-associated endoribonuclease Cas6 [Clostridium estertheticum]|uniref:CRISPR-associated endoribonuclease Cas6 n=1 Tax=Clostridium estertheticum TaxID=238834 RepID=A0AA47EPY5_9CLOT|nr:CRISPR-associated endoribonuclease Cas6 [Clostridium estertheticum]MBU3157835.1 CRISPR-associated endoribonuclease Cas6 [Clostridium estertheticum]MBU3202203.1 CRISPR-associated endoribonuclease Cas6 [Clostridium estertheticum]WAG62583.1 CRISPR-associated endoribonuclease Cas6 [Clostridium estertheticum]WAG67910.1 CRISPR-associated endoribonuclease Cas6 [Clostridium estertheticum]
MLNYYNICFRNTQRIENTIDTARIWHGIFFKILKEYNEEISTQYHGQQSKQSFSISPIFSEQYSNIKYFTKQSLLKVNIALFSDEMHKGLLEYIKKNSSVNYGEAELLIEEVHFKIIDEEVLEASRVKRGTMNFISPTAFRINPVNSPLPSPRRIFKSLSKSYSEIFKHELLPEEVIDQIEKYVVVEGLNINTEVAKYRKFDITGFKGMVTLNVKFPDNEIQRNLEKLFALASYVGIGYKTGMGMGQCIVLKK